MFSEAAETWLRKEILQRHVEREEDTLASTIFIVLLAGLVEPAVI